MTTTTARTTRWTVIEVVVGVNETTWRAKDGARIAKLHTRNDAPGPTDADFDEAMTFALAKWRAKMGR